MFNPLLSIIIHVGNSWEGKNKIEDFEAHKMFLSRLDFSPGLGLGLVSSSTGSVEMMTCVYF